MDGQISIFDITKPDYHGAMDEIARESIELDFEMSIKLHKCRYCDRLPAQYFRGKTRIDGATVFLMIMILLTFLGRCILDWIELRDEWWDMIDEEPEGEEDDKRRSD